MELTVKMESTPNPNAIKFSFNRIMFDEPGSISAKKGDTTNYQMLNQLLTIDGIDNLFCYQDFITVNKVPSVEWDSLLPEIEKTIQNSNEKD